MKLRVLAARRINDTTHALEFNDGSAYELRQIVGPTRTDAPTVLGAFDAVDEAES